MQATVRNTAHADEPFAAEVDGAAGNRIEYALAAVNTGKATLVGRRDRVHAAAGLGCDARRRQLPGAAGPAATSPSARTACASATSRPSA